MLLRLCVRIWSDSGADDVPRYEWPVLRMARRRLCLTANLTAACTSFVSFAATEYSEMRPCPHGMSLGVFT